jgi:hypothetical protein
MMLFAANVSGMTVAYHFCGKFFQYFELTSHKKKSKCCCGGKTEKKGCCKTKHCQVKIDESKSSRIQINLEQQLAAEVILPVVLFTDRQTEILPNTSLAVPLANSPPSVRTVHLFILHQQFLI